MELRDKEKIVKTIGAADLAILKLENNINAFESEGKSPPKSDVRLLNSIHRSIEMLKTNPFAGDNVQRDLWPKEFESLPNLFRMELSQFWRMLYYVIGDEVKVISIVFEVSDHKKYNKIFGYRKK
jgi:Txe/YoeB family toxin of Txe-Axe toxin-antitoxin module